mmetsp:Transcript_71527/g.221179  ORF Transcript_71527/g.221179 Transcript_71527/m.221179 type:complete len:350 (-) Transcript_71527:579-1628(-)
MGPGVGRLELGLDGALRRPRGDAAHKAEEGAEHARASDNGLSGELEHGHDRLDEEHAPRVILAGQLGQHDDGAQHEEHREAPVPHLHKGGEEEVHQQDELHAHGAECRVAEVERHSVQLAHCGLHVVRPRADDFLARQESLEPAHERAKGLWPEVAGEDELSAVPAHLPLAPAGVVGAGRLLHECVGHVERGSHGRFEGIVAQDVNGDNIERDVRRADDSGHVGPRADDALPEEGRLAEEACLDLRHGAEDDLSHRLQVRVDGVRGVAAEADGGLDDVGVGVCLANLQDVLHEAISDPRIAIEHHQEVKVPALDIADVGTCAEERLPPLARRSAVQLPGAVGEGGVMTR